MVNTFSKNIVEREMNTDITNHWKISIWPYNTFTVTYINYFLICFEKCRELKLEQNEKIANVSTRPFLKCEHTIAGTTLWV